MNYAHYYIDSVCPNMDTKDKDRIIKICGDRHEFPLAEKVLAALVMQSSIDEDNLRKIEDADFDGNDVETAYLKICNRNALIFRDWVSDTRPGKMLREVIHHR